MLKFKFIKKKVRKFYILLAGSKDRYTDGFENAAVTSEKEDSGILNRLKKAILG